jgi:hypothetical protein
LILPWLKRKKKSSTTTPANIRMAGQKKSRELKPVVQYLPERDVGGRASPSRVEPTLTGRSSCKPTSAKSCLPLLRRRTCLSSSRSVRRTAGWWYTLEDGRERTSRETAADWLDTVDGGDVHRRWSTLTKRSAAAG